MKKLLISRTKEIIDSLPEAKLEAAASFLEWLAEEKLSKEDWEIIQRGEVEIKDGKLTEWRKIARTV